MFWNSNRSWVIPSACLVLAAFWLGHHTADQPVGPLTRSLTKMIAISCPAVDMPPLAKRTVAESAHALDRWALMMVEDRLLGGNRCRQPGYDNR